MTRIYLSPPHLGDREWQLVREAFASNWIAPVGPHVDAFEQEVARWVGLPHAVALASGTAALHLAVRLLGVRQGDTVLCPTLTFSASANPIVYEGGTPVFIDADPATWNMDPDLVREELREGAARGKLPRAAIVVDLYGQCADYDPIVQACAEYDVPVIEDAAEALGATYKGRMAGTLGKVGVFSFNGNKIITTSGGGMLLSRERGLVDKARFLATQARDPAPHYQHSVIGYNYRMSNVLAAIGRGQFSVLPDRVAARRRNYAAYRSALAGLPGVAFMPQAAYGQSNSWLTCITIDQARFGATREDVRLALEAADIEARPVWKPLHMQPVFAGCRVRRGSVARDIFEHGLCLPSGSSLTTADLARIIGLIQDQHRRA